MSKGAVVDIREVRGIIASIDDVRTILEDGGAVLESDYAFSDHIYIPFSGEYDLTFEFHRVRNYTKNNWQTKPTVYVHKKLIKDNENAPMSVVLKKEFEDYYECISSFLRVEKSLENINMSFS